jgi:hypothetical protein
MAANNYPKNAIFLLDLYKESIGMPNDVYDYVKGLFSTAFQEGILYQLDKDTNEIINKIHGNSFQHHRRAEEN